MAFRRLKHDLLLPDKINAEVVKQSQQLQETHENVAILQELSVVADNLLEMTKVQNQSKSSAKGVFHQMLLTSAVLIMAAGCGMPIGFSAVILPQLYNSSDDLQMDLDVGSWFGN
ncbi:hypothetical protein Bhyg_00821 [Pseudolycoriella hygida]|uniref:Uncharacterized protein n=1 Tax=Pseudolycoriella hygida TaxID=35572 RepID=A0A9Q0N8L0_9DIPT|nr:hypothetical protein Bhyg_00821 [Pseudolycoriella hygida]